MTISPKAGYFTLSRTTCERGVEEAKELEAERILGRALLSQGGERGRTHERTVDARDSAIV